MTIRARLAAGVAVVALLSACAGPAARPRPPSVSASGSTAAVHALGSGARIFSWTLPGRAHAPWLLYVHGGSWYRGRGNSPTAAGLAAHEVPRGYQVFSVDYRQSTAATWPAARTDVAAAVDWVRARSRSLGIDPARGAIIGESAGGQLAALEATRGRVAGAVDLAGVVDPLAALRAPFRPLGAAARTLVGCAPDQCAATWEDTRVAAHLGPRTPPFLIVHSENDPIVPVGQSRTFAAELRAAGRPVALRIVPGRSHGVLEQPGVLAMVERFVDRVTARG